MAQPAESTGALTKELRSSISVVESLAPAARTAAATGAGVDLAGYESATVLIHAGDWTDGSHVFSLAHSPDNQTYEAVASGQLLGSFPTVSGEDGDDQVYVVGYVGPNRYLRAMHTVSGSPGTGLVSSALIIKGHARHQGD